VKAYSFIQNEKIHQNRVDEANNLRGMMNGAFTVSHLSSKS